MCLGKPFSCPRDGTPQGPCGTRSPCPCSGSVEGGEQTSAGWAKAAIAVQRGLRSLARQRGAGRQRAAGGRREEDRVVAEVKATGTPASPGQPREALRHPQPGSTCGAP